MLLHLRIKTAPHLLPAVIVIRRFNGKILCIKRILKSENRLKVCLPTGRFILSVRSFNGNYGEQSEYFCLPRFLKEYCMSIRLGFNDSPTGRIQRLTLKDRNYLFPIGEAKLFFISIT